MLRLVEDRQQKIESQEVLVDILGRAWREREVRRIVWRPGGQKHPIAHNHRFWFSTVLLSRDRGTPRYWNSFGLYKEKGNLHISVEINIPTETNTARVAGFFAIDPLTRDTYVMHDGGIGGGRRGIGREAFLDWSGDQIVPVERSDGTARGGLLIAPLRDAGIVAFIERFTTKVAAFKEQVAAGSIEPSSSKPTETYSDYFPEFFGTKKGERARQLEYQSRHGEIVHALSEWREGQIPRRRSSERIIKNTKIDLGVLIDGKLAEVYEVKTDSTRQNLYTAVGQLLVHGIDGGATVRRFLVLPGDCHVPEDISKALSELGMELVRFEMNESVSIVGL